MAIQRHPTVFFRLLMLIVFAIDLANARGLKVGFYKKTCPALHNIVRKTTAQYISRAPTLAAPLLRMHFHDCFVRGCDGSVLLNSTKNHQAEKSATPSVRGFHVIDAVKSAVEKKCPGVVSCADILALVARDAVSMINGPYWKVPTGRRDGRVSLAAEAKNKLPRYGDNITRLKAEFQSWGFSVKDLVVLSGGHTIGDCHCPNFSYRLYNFTGKGDTDPKLDPNYIVHLKKKCKPGDNTTIVEMDPGSFRTFDKNYYTLVMKRRGIFESDAALLDDDESKSYVKFLANSNVSFFLKQFAESMEKLGKVGVLTGKAGEIRKHCAFVN